MLLATVVPEMFMIHDFQTVLLYMLFKLSGRNVRIYFNARFTFLNVAGDIHSSPMLQETFTLLPCYR